MRTITMPIPRVFFSVVLVMGCGLVLSAVSFAEDLVPPLVDLTSSPVVSSTSPMVPVYTYQGDRFRDPFVPLVGDPDSGRYDAPPPSGPLLPFNPTDANLKGILKTTTGRWAVLRTSDGDTYMVQNGKIFDPKRKEVEGFQGIVKEKSLVILGPTNQEVILLLRKEEEGEKTP
jgi:hypothetical protein